MFKIFNNFNINYTIIMLLNNYDKISHHFTYQRYLLIFEIRFTKIEKYNNEFPVFSSLLIGDTNSAILAGGGGKS